MEGAGGRELPLSVRLEGKSWPLTVTMATLMSILVVMYQYDGAKDWAFDPSVLLGDYSGHWWSRLLNFGLLLFVAFTGALVATCSISLNLSPPGTNMWRFRTCWSVTGMILINLMVIGQILSSFTGEEGFSGRSEFAHVILLATSGICVVLGNLLFIMLFGFCGCCYCSDKMAEKVTAVDIDVPVARTVEVNSGEGGSQNGGQSGSGSDAGELGVAESVKRNSGSRHGRLERWDTHVVRTRWESDVAYAPQRKLKKLQGGKKVEMQDVVRHPALIGNKAAKVVHNSWGGVRLWFKQLWRAVREEPGKFQYCVWVKSAVVASAVVLLYNCIVAMDVLSGAARDWDKYKAKAVDLSDAAEEGLFNGTGRNVTVGNLGDVAGHAAGHAVDAVRDVVSDKIQGLALQHVSEGVNGTVVYFNQHLVVDVLDYLDSFMPKFSVAVFVGYPLGTYIGLRVLYHVCAQYKSMSIRLGLELNQHYGSASHLADSWFGLEKKYPVGGAVFFFGTLTSAAVIQQHIFGFLFSTIFAVIGNVKKIDLIMSLIGGKLLVVLAVFLVNFLIVRFVGNGVLSTGFRIKHPHWFFIYMFVFSMVHLVLGIFYALYRLIFLLVTTFLVISRLDVSVFFTGKRLDNGHNAFMSMLVLSQVIQQNVQAGEVDNNGPHNNEQPNSQELNTAEWDPSEEPGDEIQEISKTRLAGPDNAV